GERSHPRRRAPEEAPRQSTPSRGRAGHLCAHALLAGRIRGHGTESADPQPLDTRWTVTPKEKIVMTRRYGCLLLPGHHLMHRYSLEGHDNFELSITFDVDKDILLCDGADAHRCEVEAAAVAADGRLNAAADLSLQERGEAGASPCVWLLNVDAP